MKTIDLSEWTLFSSRRNSNNYYDAGEKIMLKAFNQPPDRIGTTLEKEKLVSDYLNKAGIKTPAVYDICQASDGRLCVTYENIKNKRSLSRAISEDNSLAEPYMELLAEAGKQLHSIKCEEAWVPYYKDIFEENLKTLDFLSPERLAEIREKAAALADDDKCMHGDFHPGNYIIADGTLYAIDVADIAKGSPLYDVSQFYSMVFIMSQRARREVFHWDDELAYKCWDLFAGYYFGDAVPDRKTFVDYGFVWTVNHRHLIGKLAYNMVAGSGGYPRAF